MVICPKWTEITINMVIKLHLETVTWIDIIIMFENFARNLLIWVHAVKQTCYYG